LKDNGLANMSGADDDGPAATPATLRGRLVERDRVEWWLADGGDPSALLQDFLTAHGLPVDDLARPAGTARRRSRPAAGAAVLVGADAAAAMAGARRGAASPVPAVPDLVAVAYNAADHPRAPLPYHAATVGEWAPSWTDAEHAAAVRTVRAAIAAGEVYQVNVVGHRSAGYAGDPGAALAAVTSLPGAGYGGVLAGAGWAVGSASPERLVTVSAGTARTHPVKGTRPATAAGRRALLASPKERAEHIMIVDLERNDLGRVARPGTVRVESLFELREWAGLWQAESVVAARLRPGVGLGELLRALLPGGSVTGAPKLAAIALAADLEPVGRGPSMGALGFVTADRVDLGLTIRTVAADADRLHLWAGGGVTWGSDPDLEVAEAHAKAAPIVEAVSRLGIRSRGAGRRRG
jgi:para-aminobenzoate synthetase component I